MRHDWTSCINEQHPAMGGLTPHKLAPNARLSLFYTLTCSELDSGVLTGAVYSYPRLRQSADLLHWSNGLIVHDITCTYVWIVDLHRSGVGFAIERVRVCIGAVRYLHESRHFCNGAASKKGIFLAAPNERHKLIIEYNVWFSARER